jgi:hypothetical protein
MWDCPEKEAQPKLSPRPHFIERTACQLQKARRLKKMRRKRKQQGVRVSVSTEWLQHPHILLTASPGCMITCLASWHQCQSLMCHWQRKTWLLLLSKVHSRVGGCDISTKQGGRDIKARRRARHRTRLAHRKEALAAARHLGRAGSRASRGSGPPSISQMRKEMLTGKKWV